MSVIRINKTKDYTIMSNAHLKEKEKKDEIFDIINQICIDKCEK